MFSGVLYLTEAQSLTGLSRMPQPSQSLQPKWKIVWS